MNILMTGGTGFIGSRFVNKLVNEGHHVYVITRYPRTHKDTESVSYISFEYPVRRLPTIHAVVNLAGESLFGYWSKKKKEMIYASRIEATERLVNMMLQMEKKPKVILSGSAIGYYGTQSNKIFTENTTHPSDDFLASVVSTWENTAQHAEDLGIRTVYTRFGVVLDRDNGALPLMTMPIKLFIGGKIGDGKQWISWIHISDCINLLYYALVEPSIKGPINVTAPNPQRNIEFIKTLARVLRRPALICTPAPILQIALGDMHQLITKGQYIIPQKAIDQQFTFQYPYLEEALQHIFNRN
ncbi:TIGR01777 family oxidoreductase [Pseudogracilibacillus sp. SO30301A]|uniref:TIGR01777 family oxidoreductase n=1 Tax=Pseudogracilibacillus sp. SO30301A TaxID=3098291 RepID=UPI00300DDB82